MTKNPQLGIYCTKVQKLEIEMEFEFYRNVFYEELDIFMSAFINAQGIFPADAPKESFDKFNERDIRVGTVDAQLLSLALTAVISPVTCSCHHLIDTLHEQLSFMFSIVGKQCILKFLTLQFIQ